MPLINSIRSYLRFLLSYAAGVRAFMATMVTLDEAHSSFERELRDRDESFLHILETAVYERPSNPYRKLLVSAGIEFPDVRRMVQDLGLEASLDALYSAGVFLTQEEFKGRQPVQRNGLNFSTIGADFDMPFSSESGGYLTRRSSGATGSTSEVKIDFSDCYQRAVTLFLTPTTQSTRGRPLAFWYTGDMTSCLYLAKTGLIPERNFSTRRLSWRGNEFKGTFLASYTLLLCRLFGRPLPPLEYVPLDQAFRIAEWLAEKVARSTPPVLRSLTSPAIRVCLAAKELHLDIRGTLFDIGGEALTPAKAEVITGVGAQVMTRYAAVETGFIGYACGNPTQADEVHLLSNKIAMIEREKKLPSGASVPALVFTSLSQHSPKLLINVESGDYATVKVRDCGCPLQTLGLLTHLTWIRSHDKLTSEGVTFMGERLIQLLEQDLPDRFGGTVGDYQIVEEEENGLTKVSVVVAPRVGTVDEVDLLSTVVQALKESHSAGSYWTDLWRQGNALRLIRREPYMTQTSKVMPIHVLREAGTARKQ
jgi:hypothetical protein